MQEPQHYQCILERRQFRPGAKMIIIGQALTTYRRNSMFALTTKQSEVAFDVHEALYFLKRAGLNPNLP